MKNLNKEVGSYCEKIARTYLKKNDYNILECNFKNFLGEIDIICQKDGLIIIIEVKAGIIMIMDYLKSQLIFLNKNQS